MRDLFKLALKRDPGAFHPEPGHRAGIKLVLGIGETGKHQSSTAPGYRPLGLPEWSFPRDKIPFGDGTVSFIHCYHFMEHLEGSVIPGFLLEVQRVLVPGGIFQYGVPLAGTELSYQDLDHKSFWTTSSFKNLLDNVHYQASKGNILKILSTAIIGITERNLMVCWPTHKGKRVMKLTMIDYTGFGTLNPAYHAENVLMFAKNTRLMRSADMINVEAMLYDKRAEELAYIARTIPSCWGVPPLHLRYRRRNPRLYPPAGPYSRCEFRPANDARFTDGGF